MSASAEQSALAQLESAWSKLKEARTDLGKPNDEVTARLRTIAYEIADVINHGAPDASVLDDPLSEADDPQIGALWIQIGTMRVSPERGIYFLMHCPDVQTWEAVRKVLEQVQEEMRPDGIGGYESIDEHGHCFSPADADPERLIRVAKNMVTARLSGKVMIMKSVQSARGTDDEES